MGVRKPVNAIKRCFYCSSKKSEEKKLYNWKEYYDSLTDRYVCWHCWDIHCAEISRFYFPQNKVSEKKKVFTNYQLLKLG